MSEAGPAEHVHEVVLHTEQVLVSTRVVPVERVRMVRRVVTTDHTVTESVHTEQVDVEITDTDPGDIADDDGHHHLDDHQEP